MVDEGRGPLEPGPAPGGPPRQDLPQPLAPLVGGDAPQQADRLAADVLALVEGLGDEQVGQGRHRHGARRDQAHQPDAVVLAEAPQNRDGDPPPVLLQVVRQAGEVVAPAPHAPVDVSGEDPHPEHYLGDARLVDALDPQQAGQPPGRPPGPVPRDPRCVIGGSAGLEHVHNEDAQPVGHVRPPGGRVLTGVVGAPNGAQHPAQAHPLGRAQRPVAVQGIAQFADDIAAIPGRDGHPLGPAHAHPAQELRILVSDIAVAVLLEAAEQVVRLLAGIDPLDHLGVLPG